MKWLLTISTVVLASQLALSQGPSDRGQGSGGDSEADRVEAPSAGDRVPPVLKPLEPPDNRFVTLPGVRAARPARVVKPAVLTHPLAVPPMRPVPLTVPALLMAPDIDLAPPAKSLPSDLAGANAQTPSALAVETVNDFTRPASPEAPIPAPTTVPAIETGFPTPDPPAASTPPAVEAPAPVTQPAVSPAVEAPAPVTQPAEAPATEPPVLPAAQPAAAPATEPPVLPAAQPAAAPATEPPALPAMQPAEAPSTEPPALPAMQPAEAPSTEPPALPAMQPAVPPATEPPAPTPVIPVAPSQTKIDPAADFQAESALFLQKQIGWWTLADARALLGNPSHQRPALADNQTPNGQIYAFSDPSGRYKEVELDFDAENGNLRTVFVYPYNMTWQECRHQFGATVSATQANKGRIFYSYTNRRLDVLVAPSGQVISLGLY